MKLALALMVTPNDLPFLRLHLPVYKGSFDGLIAIADPAEGDSAITYMQSIGADVLLSTWQYDWGDFANQMFNHAETLGYDAALRMDGDECLMHDAGYRIKQLLETVATLLVFPRHEFFGDRYHVRGDIWPDDQARAWRLRRGIALQGKKHEGIGFAQHGLSEHVADPDHRVLRVREESLSIFHYGWSSRTAIWNAMTKYQSQAQVAVGMSPAVNFPPDQPLAHHPTIPFSRPQPLNPDLVGLTAPFKE